MISTQKNCRGFTLIEMLIAMLVGLFLLGGIISVFQNTQQSGRLNEGASRLQETGRFAIDILTRDIRMSGYQPCRINVKSGVPQVANSLNGNDPVNDFFSNPIGIDEGGPSSPGTFTGYPPVGAAPGDRVANADAVRVLRGGSESTCVASHNSNAASMQLCTPSSSFNQFDILLVCDAEQASIMQMSGPASAPPHTTLVHNTGVGAPGNCNKFLGTPTTPGDCSTNAPYQFGQDAQIVKFTSTAYFIGVSSTGNTTSLYRQVLGQPAQELFEDIETMQIRYGIDTVGGDGVADRYVSGDGVADPNTVVSVRLGLLVRSPDELPAGLDTRTYNVAGTSVGTATPISHPSDRRIRTVYNTTIKLRNRGIQDPAL